MDLLWKVIIKLFGYHKEDYVNAISIGEDTYMINIHKFVSPEKELQDGRMPLGKQGHQIKNNCPFLLNQGLDRKEWGNAEELKGSPQKGGHDTTADGR